MGTADGGQRVNSKVVSLPADNTFYTIEEKAAAPALECVPRDFLR
jgi:hypothetical protein